MPKDPSELAVQIHLAEYSALRQEMLEMIKWRERLVFLSFGISGALFSFALSESKEAGTSVGMSHRMALYLIPPLAAAIGGLWLVNAHRIYRIGIYIRDVLAPRLNALLDYPAGKAAALEVFGWESSTERVMNKWSRRLLEWVVLLAAFVLAGAAAQYLILAGANGTLLERFRQLESPFGFSLNCVVLIVSFLLLAKHLWFGRKNKGSSAIRQA